MFPECILGKGMPLIDLLDERRRQRKRTTDLMDKNGGEDEEDEGNGVGLIGEDTPVIVDPREFSIVKRPMTATKETGRRQRPTRSTMPAASIGTTKCRRSGLAGKEKQHRHLPPPEEHQQQRRIGQKEVRWNPPVPPSTLHPLPVNPPPPMQLEEAQPSRSPPSSPSSFSSSSSFSNNSSYSSVGEEKAILFRLPLTITRAKPGQSLADLEVRERRPDGHRGHSEQVDFTEMGLFVAPPSETDPEEAFVVVERRKLQ
jgi:hypothetical protein